MNSITTIHSKDDRKEAKIYASDIIISHKEKDKTSKIEKNSRLFYDLCILQADFLFLINIPHFVLYVLTAGNQKSGSASMRIRFKICHFLKIKRLQSDRSPALRKRRRLSRRRCWAWKEVQLRCLRSWIRRTGYVQPRLLPHHTYQL